MPKAKPTFPRLGHSRPLAVGSAAAWAFYEGGGTKLRDLTGRGNDGTLTNGPIWSKGQSGYALSFDGSDDFIDIPWPLKKDITAAIQNGTVTFSCWANFSSVPGSEIGFIGVGDSSNNGLNLAYLPGTGFTFWYSGGNVVGGSSTAATGIWYHVCGVVASLSDIKVYVNGAQVTSGSSGLGSFTLTPISNRMAIGNEGQVQAGRYFAGLMDHVLIYNRALSAAEVRQLYADPWEIYRQPDNRAMFGPYASAGAPPPTTAQIYPAMQGQLNSGGFVGTRWV